MFECIEGHLAGISVIRAETILEDEPERRHPVAPVDLFTFLVSPAIINDGDFIHAKTVASRLGGDLRLDTEPVRLQREDPQTLGGECFVAGFHVREVDVVEHVGQEGQEPVAHRVPEIQHLSLFTRKARAKDCVGLSLQNRLEQPAIVAWIVLQVRILKKGDVSGHLLDGPADGGALSHICWLLENPYFRMRTGESLRNFPGGVRRAVIHQDDFPGQTFRQRSRQDPFRATAQRGFFIVGRHQERQFGKAPR